MPYPLLPEILSQAKKTFPVCKQFAGIGKSTLLLQMCENIDKKILYVTGEESDTQIKLRASRLGVHTDNLLILLLLYFSLSSVPRPLYSMPYKQDTGQTI